MKSLVKFDARSCIAFLSKETYEAAGIATYFEGDMLVGLAVTIEHREDAEYAELIAQAHRKIVRLMELVHFGSGVPLQLGPAHVRPIESDSVVMMGGSSMKANAVITRPIPLPPSDMVARLCDDEVRQLAWYNSAEASATDIEKIRSYYQVLECEKQITNGQYTPPAEMEYLRDAVSHPRLNRKVKAIEFLQNNLGTNHIDLSNSIHLSFIKTRVEPLCAEARRVIEVRLPKWW